MLRSQPRYRFSGSKTLDVAPEWFGREIGEGNHDAELRPFRFVFQAPFLLPIDALSRSTAYELILALLFRERAATGHHYEILQDAETELKIRIKVTGRDSNPEAYCACLQDQIDFLIGRILDPPPMIPLPPPRSIWEWVRENPYKDAV